jgi:serine phosphatase RsbU (regulator of sigma subunit)
VDNPDSAVHRILRGAAAEKLTVDAALLARLTADTAHQRLYGELGLAEALMAPVTSRAGVEGVLTLGRTRGSRPYEGEDLRLAEEVGRRIGVAVENARLYARERDTAVTLQHTLLPRLPELPGLALAARYLPSSLAGQVGGDWYDVLALPDGNVGVAVGDVAGHDLTAAAAMGQLRAVLRSYAWDDDAPGQVLDRVCRLVRGLDDDTMATVLYARLSPPGPDGGRDLVYASAGHPPSVLVLPGGGTELLEVVSPVIGIETDPRAQGRVAVPRGATLLCYSDGLVERRGEDLGDGIEALRRVAAEHASLPVDDLAERVLTAMVPQGPVDDDIALLVLRVL